MKTSQKRCHNIFFQLSVLQEYWLGPCEKISTDKYSQAILWQIEILNPQLILVLYFFMIISIHSLHLVSDITNIPNMLFRSLAESTQSTQSSRVSLVLCLETLYVPCYVPFYNQDICCFLQGIV